MFSVTVAVVAIPTRTLGKFNAQQFIDDLDRVDHSRIVGRAQAEAHQSQRVRTDDLHRRYSPTRTILDGNKSLQGRSGSVAVWGRDAHVVAFHAHLPGEIAVHRVRPAFDVVVPCVRHLAQKFGGLRLAHRLREIGGNQQRGNFGGHGKRRITTVLFPAVLLRNRAVGRDEGCGFVHHGPPAIAISEAARRFAAQQIDQQNGKGGLIHLRAAPIRTPIQPHVLRPVSIGFLSGLEIMQHAQSVVVSARGQQSAGIFDQIARPDEVVTAQVLVALVEAPGNGEAGDDAAKEVLRFVSAQNRHADPV